MNYQQWISIVEAEIVDFMADDSDGWERWQDWRDFWRADPCFLFTGPTEAARIAILAADTRRQP